MLRLFKKDKVGPDGSSLLEKKDGVYFSFNAGTRSLVVHGSDQELEILSLPRRIAEQCQTALTVDMSGNRLVSLENFDYFASCETLILDDNQLREDAIALANGVFLRKVHTLFVNKNAIKDARIFAINVANTFPNVNYVSMLSNPCCPLGEGKDYESNRLLMIYKLPSLRFLDSKRVTVAEKEKSEKTQGGSKGKVAAEGKGKQDEERRESGSSSNNNNNTTTNKPNPDVGVLKKDTQQAELVKAAKKDIKRTSSNSSIRQSAGLAETSAAGLVKASPSLSRISSTDSSGDERAAAAGPKLSKPIDVMADSDEDDDSSCLIGASDDSSEAPPSAVSVPGASKEERSPRGDKNFAMLRSVSLSGRKLEEHFQYAKVQPEGKLVDREGWLNMRLRKTKWKKCWFVLKGGALFRFRSPNDELFVEQIIISGAAVSKSANRKGHCFKIEKGGEKIVFQCEDAWDQATWIIQLEKWIGPDGIAPGSAVAAKPAPMARTFSVKDFLSKTKKDEEPKPQKKAESSANASGSDNDSSSSKKKRWSLR